MTISAGCIPNPFSTAVHGLGFSRRRRSKTDAIAPPSECGGGAASAAEIRTDEFRQVFRLLDANGDGRISADELAAYFASAGDSGSIEEARMIIQEISGGGDDRQEDSLLLGFEEFERAVELRATEDDRAVLRQAFEVYELEKGSGCITPEGIRRVLRRLGDDKTVQECEGMIRAYDLDGNGVLDFDEFLEAIQIASQWQTNFSCP